MKTYYITFILALTSLCACNSSKSDNNSDNSSSSDSVKSAEQVCGGDRDEHGCIGSAGYTWSEVKNDCIRVWEEGRRLECNDTTSCFAVFATDSAKVEIFYSDSRQNSILSRVTPSKWNSQTGTLDMLPDSILSLTTAKHTFISKKK